MVGGRWPAAAPGPAPGDLVLLADPRLVGEPELYPARLDALLPRDLVKTPGEAFFKILNRPFGLSMVPRTGGELAVAPRAQLPAQGLRRHRDPELVEDPLAQVDEPPSHDPMHRRNRAAFDHRRQRRPVRVLQLRGLPGRLAVDQTIGPRAVELDHPVAHDLHRDAANPGRLRARPPVVDRRQSQEPPGLRGILRPPGKGPQSGRVEISPERNRHGEPPAFAMLNQILAASGIPTPSHDLRELVLGP